jgi:hypothetical protein
MKRKTSPNYSLPAQTLLPFPDHPEQQQLSRDCGPEVDLIINKAQEKKLESRVFGEPSVLVANFDPTICWQQYCLSLTHLTPVLSTVCASSRFSASH